MINILIIIKPMCMSKLKNIELQKICLFTTGFDSKSGIKYFLFLLYT